MPRRSLLLQLPAVLLVALRRPPARPGAVLLLLALNLALALVVVAPVRSLLSAELDTNLYGEEMATGASWRWFDTVDRQHPRAVGNPAPWTALFSAEGVRWKDLRAVSGPPAAVLLAGLLLFLLHGPLHVGYLATGASLRRRSGAGEAAGPAGTAGLLAVAWHRGPPALLLGLLAALAYAAVYAAVYVAPAALLGRLAESLQREWIHLFQVWGRLGVTVLLLLAVKVFFDLAKLGLALPGRPGEPAGSGGLGAALALAGRETARRGWAYLGVDLVLGALLLAASALWWWLSAPLDPVSWLGLAILFVLHQLFMALRIALRLAHLEATAEIHGRAAAAPVPPGPAVETRDGAGDDGGPAGPTPPGPPPPG